MGQKLVNILNEAREIDSTDYWGLRENDYAKLSRLRQMHDQLRDRMNEYGRKASAALDASILTGGVPLVAVLLLTASDYLAAAIGVGGSFLSAAFAINLYYSRNAAKYRAAHDEVLHTKWNAENKIDDVELPELALAVAHEKDPLVRSVADSILRCRTKMDLC